MASVVVSLHLLSAFALHQRTKASVTRRLSFRLRGIVVKTTSRVLDSRRIDLDQCANPNFRFPLSRKSLETGMPYSAESYVKRAEECVRLANFTGDQIVQADILKLRQNYLRTAERFGSSKPALQGGPTGHDRK